MVSNRAGILYVVATPIGNLDDLTARARRVLADVDVIAAEDTRHTGKLLASAGIHARMLSLHEHNETGRVPEILAMLGAGQSVALVSDAGTPLVSDPGYRLLRAVRDAGFVASPVPGPCAAIAALSIAGLPTDRVLVEGFLADRAGPRRERLEAVAAETATLVYYVSVHKIARTLDDMCAVFGPDRDATLARELTKLHETLWHGTLGKLVERLKEAGGALKGEIVLVVAGAQPGKAGSADIEQLLRVLLEELPPARAAKLAGRITGRPRSEIYPVALALGGKTTD